MECLEFDRLLDNYESLDASERNVLNSHAQECERCRSELEFYRSIIQASVSLPAIEPPADLLDKINARIDNLPTAAKRWDKAVNNFRIYSKQYTTVAACLALGLVVGLNSRTIQDKLTRNGADDVISTSVSVDDGGRSHSDHAPYRTTDEDVREPEQVDDTETADKADSAAKPQSSSGQNEAENTKTAKGQAAQVRTEQAPSSGRGSQDQPATSRPAAQNDRVQQSSSVRSNTASAPSSTNGASANRIPAAKSSPTQSVVSTNRPVSVPTAEPVREENTNTVQIPVGETVIPAEPDNSTAVVEPTEKATETTKSRYTIARGDYHIPDTAAVSQPTEMPASVTDKEIIGEKYQIAMGAYDVSEDERKALSQNKLIVNESDKAKIIEYMNSSWIQGTTEGYKATSTAFANFLAKLDAEGIYYNYIQLSDEGSEVYFILLAN